MRWQAGQRDDGFGLMDTNARFYSPSLGRFVSADTIVPGAGNPLAWDRYAYGLNNPLRYIDPSGHKSCSDTDNDGNCIDDGWKPLKVTRRMIADENLNWVGWFGRTQYAYEDHLNYVAGKSNYNYDGYCRGYHCGMDLGADWGDDVYAPVDGTSTWFCDAGKNGGMKIRITSGNYIIQIEHLASFSDVVGSNVFIKAGTKIGTVGNPSAKESDKNYHIHVEIRHGGLYANNPLAHMDTSSYSSFDKVADSASSDQAIIVGPGSRDPRHQGPINIGSGGNLWEANPPI